MTRRRDRLTVLLAALIAGMAHHRLSAAEPLRGTSSPTGTVQLAPGLTAHYEYHYDRNAMADALVSGDSLIALTDSGNLLRFDRTTLARTREWFGPTPVTCLGRGEDGSVLAGFADGRIARLDPADLALAEVARVPGPVRWVGAFGRDGGRPARPRIIAVAERTEDVEIRGRKYPVPRSVVHDLGTGRTHLIEAKSETPTGRRATAFLLDRKHRLWLGADNGEWGGWCSYVDLDAGKVHPVPGLKIYDADISPDPAWHGVFGFTELRDGQVWAHGGTTHMGMTNGFIWRVDRGKAEELYEGENDPAPPNGGPCLPITHVDEDAATGSLRVLAFGTIYRTDAKLARWEEIHGLEIRYRSGRPDAVGSYPSVRSVLPIDEAGRPRSLLFATRLDGLVRLADGKETGHALPGQLGAESVGEIAPSSEGLLVLGGASDGETWRYRDGAWAEVSFAPPFAPADPRGPSEGNGRDGWYESVPLIGGDGSIVTVNASAVTPGTRTIARWRDGKAEILAREVSGLKPSACFVTPDGGIWNADGALRRLADGRWIQDRIALRRLVGGRWIEVAGFDWPRGVRQPGWIGLGWGLFPLNNTGPPWVLRLDLPGKTLIRLTYGPGFKDPRMELIPLAMAGPPEPLKLRAAIPWSKGELLLATDRGLRTLAIDGSRLGTPALNTGGRPVSRLARDGLGRTWLGGEGLAVLEADGKTLHPLDELPMIGRAKVAALAADPDHPDGAVAAIEGRGVVYLRVEGRR